MSFCTDSRQTISPILSSATPFSLIRSSCRNLRCRPRPLVMHRWMCLQSTSCRYIKILSFRIQVRAARRASPFSKRKIKMATTISMKVSSLEKTDRCRQGRALKSQVHYPVESKTRSSSRSERAQARSAHTASRGTNTIQAPARIRSISRSLTTSPAIQILTARRTIAPPGS